MSSRPMRILVLVAGSILVFATVAAVLLHLIPAPRREVDYLVIGVLATLAAMGAAFVALIAGVMKLPGVFFVRRRKQ